VIRETYSSEETFRLGEELGGKAAAGEIYALSGDLGTGKTVFAQGFAKGLGINEYVNSPTFTILQVYEDGRLPLYHFDVYRIEEPEEMEEIGFEDYFYGDGVTLIEWAELIRELLPENIRRISIEKDLDRGNDYRRITVQTGDPD
jgi:tRNA threonylcarbamoyladenosine biosynthesis protein TsaE